MNKFVFVYWEGDIKKGKGIIFMQSGVFKEQFYGFNICFEDEFGINLEELIGVVYVGCFLMVFFLELGNVGYIVDSIDIKVKVILDKDGDGFSIIKIYLDMNVRIFGIDDVEFQKIVNGVKEGCLVFKVFNVEIILDVKFG